MTLTKQQKQTYAGIAVAAIAILFVFWFVKSRPQTEPVPTSNQNTSNQNTTEPTKISAPENTEMQKNFWTGVLKNSDDSKKGNLMLVTSDRTIYIQTSRDYKDLIDKTVRVSYQGDWQSFMLGDISIAEQQ